MPRISIKGQVLADLVAEFTEPPIEELESAKNMDEKFVGTISQHGFSPWEVYVDGGIESERFWGRVSTDTP